MIRKRKTSKELPDSFFEKVLCFTTSYKRPYMLYNCIKGILNQTHSNFLYSVNINIDNERDKVQYEELLKEFKNNPKLSVIYTQNSPQHENYLKPILNQGREKYNLFIKIDDDDIYHSDYISKMISLYKKNKTDILSCSLNKTINGPNVEFGKFESIGVWKPDTESNIKFGMPCTYVFNQSALNILIKLSTKDISKIHRFEDPAWRTAWRDAGLTSSVVENFELATYHIHGKNSSSSFMYNDEDQEDINYIEDDNFILAIFKHRWWQSYVYLNKRNNRMYQINNDDHGAFVLSEDQCKITWDNWGEEIFHKEKIGNKYRFVMK